MAASSTNILVFGATGLIGKYITEALINEKSSFGTIGIFTSKSTLDTKAPYIEFLRSQNVQIHVGDVSDEKDILNAYKSYDTIICAFGRAVIASQIPLLALAEQTPNIKRFFPSEYGTDIEYGPQSPKEKPHQQKLKVRKYIRENVKRVEVTYLVTGPYVDGYIGKPRADVRMGGFDVEKRKAYLLGSGKERVAFTTMADVGRLLVAAVKSPEQSKNKALIVNSFTATPDEVLAEYEKQTGAKWEKEYIPLDQLKQLEEEAWEKGVPWATGFTLKRIWTEGGTLYESRDNEAIGFTNPDTLEEAVAKAIKVQDTAASEV
ncbi:putative GTP-binding protein [Venturia nashicola]|uniref:Putative GTP-binding protein n=1 Tax=Venturia nashicola TaxID=86259 RepID=A0A4Z1PC26_9PEZI|nr:putative GTP-binding protein [Venturia nashicola]